MPASPAALDAHRNEIRRQREPRWPDADAAIFYAREDCDADALAKAQAIAHALRNAPAHPALDEAEDDAALAHLTLDRLVPDTLSPITAESSIHAIEASVSDGRLTAEVNAASERAIAEACMFDLPTEQIQWLYRIADDPERPPIRLLDKRGKAMAVTPERALQIVRDADRVRARYEYARVSLCAKLHAAAAVLRDPNPPILAFDDAIESIVAVCADPAQALAANLPDA